MGIKVREMALVWHEKASGTACHWSTLWPLEVWVHGLYSSGWFCVNEVIVYRVMMYTNPLLIVQAVYFTSNGQSVYLIQYSGVVSENI